MNKPLYLKHVAFVGSFNGGSLPLKDIVYKADGAPVENIAVFTNYLVVGDGGRETKLYQKWAKHIEAGYLILLTPDELRGIAEGKTPVPEYKHECVPGSIVFATKEMQERKKQNDISVWQSKREMFAERYGVLQPNGSRIKMNIRAAKAIVKTMEELGQL